MPQFDLQYILTTILVLSLSLSVHEYSHARMAYALGDDTAKLAGRLTLNPLAHLDPLGAIFFLIMRFGWAKPVPVDPRKFTKAKSQKQGMMLVSIAGPLSNLLISFVSAFVINLIIVVVEIASRQGGLNSASAFNIVGVLISVAFAFYYSNIFLAVFNLLPLPPLDGSKILGYFLPDKANYQMYRYQRYISLAVFLLFIFARPFIGRILNAIASPFDYILMKPWQVLANFILSKVL